MATFTEQDSAALRAMVDTHMKAVLAHDPAAFLATCSDDIVFLPPGQSSLSGHAACRAFLEDFPTPATFVADVADADGDGDLGFTRGRAKATFDDGSQTTFSFVGIHRRQPDGSWRMVRDIWNDDEAPAAS